MGDHDFAPRSNGRESKEFKETAEAIRKSGKAKFVGFSTHHPRRPEILQAAAEGRVRRRDHAPVQSLDRPGRRDEPGLDACHKAGIGLISMKQVAGNVEPGRDRPRSSRNSRRRA